MSTPILPVRPFALGRGSHVAADVAPVAAVAAADVAVDAAVAADPRWCVIRKAVYDAVYPMLRQQLAPMREARLQSALRLLDEMLPAEPLMAPVVSIEDARVICAAPEALAA